MKDLLFFDKMITPKIITIVYWVLLVCVVLGNIISLIAGFSVWKLLGMFVFIPLMALGVRIYCELLIVMFKMNEALQQIRNK